MLAEKNCGEVHDHGFHIWYYRNYLCFGFPARLEYTVIGEQLRTKVDRIKHGFVNAQSIT